MARKHFKVSGRMLFTWFMLAGAILLLAPQTVTSRFQGTFAHIFHWPLKIGRGISLAARSAEPSTDVVSRREYNKLANHLANMTELLRQEHQKVETLADLRNRFALETATLLPADVVTASVNGTRSELLINRGSEDGIGPEQFVLGDNSVIGRVLEVWPTTARVKLLSDPTFKIPVSIPESAVQGVMQGRGNGLCKIELIPVEQKVKTGLIVYAQKLPGLLDIAIITGKVSQCRRLDENPWLWDITVQPVCDIEKLQSVTVIIMNRKK